MIKEAKNIKQKSVRIKIGNRECNIHMHLERYIEEIQNQYAKQSDIYVKNRKAKRVFRGRQRIISSFAEDEFAKRICKIFNQNIICVFVDQPISYSNKGKTNTIYPDIMICKKENDSEFKILYLIDLKMDIGWGRNSKLNYYKKLKKMCTSLNKSKEISGKIYDSDEDSKIRTNFTIDSNASYDEVLISSRNAGNIDEEIKKLSRDTKNNFWCLSFGKHPNSKKKEGKIELNYNDWLSLINNIQSVVKKYD